MRSSCPRSRSRGKDAAGIFATDVGGIDWADGLVAIAAVLDALQKVEAG